MKLHLPPSLLRALALATSVLGMETAYSAALHSDVSILTYTDFGQNLGRYKTQDTSNALLQYLRLRDTGREDGVQITYTGGQAAQVLEHAMIDFSSQNDGGYGAAIGYNWYATVQHNGVHNNTYTGNSIGTENAVHYVGIEYRASEGNKFLHTPSNDYKITRQSKLITDVTGSAVYGSVDGDYSGITEGSLVGQLLYRAGSGTMSVREHDGSSTALRGAYGYITGGVERIDSVANYNPADGAFSSINYLDYTAEGIDTKTPCLIWAVPVTPAARFGCGTTRQVSMNTSTPCNRAAAP